MAVLLVAGCGEAARAEDGPPGEITLCGEVTRELECRAPVRAIEPGLPYMFLAHGASFDATRVTVKLARGAVIIAEADDVVVAGADAYANAITVQGDGSYRLEIWSGGRRYAERNFDAITAGERRAPDPRRGVLVECADSCGAARAAMDELQGTCAQNVSDRLAHVGCCGSTAGTFERTCGEDQLGRCVDDWMEECLRRGRPDAQRP